jgi:membrane dipeptidase
VADKCKFSGAALLFAALLGGPAAQAQNQRQDFQQRVEHVLARTPLIDGHNDLPWEIRERFNGDVAGFDFAADTSHLPLKEGQSALMTDIPRLRAGHVGAQFWSVWIPANTPGYEAVQVTLEQIDLVKRMTAHYPKDLEMAYGAADIRRIHKNGKVASLIGIEGGHQINNSLAVLRQMYDAGARYMTLTHSNNTAWADSATDNPVHHGLTAFGVEVVREMNRMGMLVDLSHVSADTMRAALRVSEAPVIFSHSSARSVDDHPRNVPDDVLTALAANGWSTSRRRTFPPRAIIGRRIWRQSGPAATRHLLAACISGSPIRPRRLWKRGRRNTRAPIRRLRKWLIMSSIFVASRASITSVWVRTSMAFRMHR